MKQWLYSELKHWNETVLILTKFSPLAALEVILTSSSAASDDNLIKMKTYLFQWRGHNMLWREHILYGCYKWNDTVIVGIWHSLCYSLCMCCLLLCVHSYIPAIYVWVDVNTVQLGVFSTKPSLFNTHYIIRWVQQTHHSINEAVALRVSCTNKPRVPNPYVISSFLVGDVLFEGVSIIYIYYTYRSGSPDNTSTLWGVRCVMDRMSSNISAVHVAVRNSMLHVKKDRMSATMRYFDLSDLPLQYIWRKL